MRKSSDPKYQHLNDDLHVEITAFAPPSEAHARIAYALTEVRFSDGSSRYPIPEFQVLEVLWRNRFSASS